MAGKKRTSETICSEAELKHENPRFFRNLFDQGLAPTIGERMRRDLVAAASEINARDGRISKRHAETVRGLTESKLEEMFLLGRQIEIAREMSTKLEPCPGCGEKVNFYFVSNPSEPIGRGYVLCCGCKATTNFRGGVDEIVDKWNNHAPADRWEEVSPSGSHRDR